MSDVRLSDIDSGIPKDKKAYKAALNAVRDKIAELKG